MKAKNKKAPIIFSLNYTVINSFSRLTRPSKCCYLSNNIIPSIKALDYVGVSQQQLHSWNWSLPITHLKCFSPFLTFGSLAKLILFNLKTTSIDEDWSLDIRTYWYRITTALFQYNENMRNSEYKKLLKTYPSSENNPCFKFHYSDNLPLFEYGIWKNSFQTFCPKFKSWSS